MGGLFVGRLPPMIALAENQKEGSLSTRFVSMLPSIRGQLRYAFRYETPEEREELMAEALADCWLAFVRLVERGADDVAFATPLAQFAIKHIRSGRQVGCRLNKDDVSSTYAQRARDFTVERLDYFDLQEETWQESLLEDRTAGPAEIAAMRIDFSAWLLTLSETHRKIAKVLATGESTKSVAEMFQLSHGRISQLRNELHDAWRRFQGELNEVVGKRPSRTKNSVVRELSLSN